SIINSGDYDSFIWSTTDVTGQITVPGPGTYNVTVTNQGCSTEGSFTVAEDAAIPPTIEGDLTICTGETTSLSVSPSYDSYSWSSGGTAGTEVIGAGGNVTVSVVDENGCAAETFVTVVENMLPDLQISGDEEICTDEFGTITLLNGSSYTDIIWSNTETDPVIVVNTPGNYSVTATDINGCVGTASFDVAEVALPGASISGMTSFCTGTNTILTADPPGMSYEWSNGADTQSATVDTDGAIFVTVTNSSGCQSIASIEVTEVTELAPEITGPTEFCSGESITLSGPAGFAGYQWSGSSETETQVVTSGGTYTLTVTDINGCTGSATVEIIENALPDPTISGEFSFCTGESTTLFAPAGMTYLWENGDTTQSISVDTIGNYGLTITDAEGCMSSSSVEVSEDALPEPEIQGISAFCPDSTVTLGLNTPFQTYLWSSGADSATIEVSTAEIITVEVTNVAGCIGFDTLETQIFTAPTVSILGDTAFCAGDSIGLESDGVFPLYSWSNGAGENAIDINEPGTYSLTITDDNGCPAQTSVTIVENALPQPEITGADFFCAGDSAVLEATPGFQNYVWDDGSNETTLTIVAQGTSFVTVTDANGCEGAASYFVDEIALPEPQIDGVPEFCPGTSTTLVASAIFNTYAWSTGDTTGTTVVSQPGNVTLTVTNIQGCIGSTSIDASEYVTQVPQIDGVPNFCPGTSTVLTGEPGFAAYEWSNNEATPEVEVTQPGTIALTVTDSNGCITSNDIEVSLYTVIAPEIGGPEGFCTDTTATLSAGTGYSGYEWSTGASSESITIDSGGVYRVTVTDANGCISMDNYQLLEYNLPDVAIGGSSSF
ncbi:MAG: hypothetical protein HRU12_12070, partial [Phaeodactylibacter sp.]|nr:hypothetical protein [Phaeodactylibacter sp.]